MASRFWVEIVCCNCATSGHGQWVEGSVIPVSGFKLEAKESGWRQRTDGEFECPKCTKKLLQQAGAQPQEVGRG